MRRWFVAVTLMLIVLAGHRAFVVSCSDRTSFGNPWCRPYLPEVIDLGVVFGIAGILYHKRREVVGQFESVPVAPLPRSLRRFFRAVLGFTVAAVAVHLGATWRAEAAFDSKQGIGDLATFNFWNAVATPAIWSARVVWVLGLLVAAYAKERDPHRWAGGLRREVWLALGLPLGLLLAGIAGLAVLWL